MEKNYRNNLVPHTELMYPIYDTLGWSILPWFIKKTLKISIGDHKMYSLVYAGKHDGPHEFIIIKKYGEDCVTHGVCKVYSDGNVEYSLHKKTIEDKIDCFIRINLAHGIVEFNKELKLARKYIKLTNINIVIAIVSVILFWAVTMTVKDYMVFKGILLGFTVASGIYLQSLLLKLKKMRR